MKDNDIKQNKDTDKKVQKDSKIDKKTHKLNEQIETLEKEKNETFEKLQRVSAEFMNYQKRVSKQISDAVSYEKESMIKSLLPVLDNFDHTLTGAENIDDVESLLKGVKIIYDQMISILKSHGIEQVASVGEQFEPATHEAMMQRAETDVEDGVILEEFQKGYKLNGRVIRPGKVIVNKKTEQKQEDTPQAEPDIQTEEQ